MLSLSDSMSHVRELHEPAQTNSGTPLQSITEVSAAKPSAQINKEDKLSQEANLYIQRHHDKPSYGNYYPYYYENLKDSIEELHELENEHQAYITQGGDSKDKPRSYLHLIEEIQTPMPFKSFTEASPKSVSNAAYAYLWLETSVLNQLQGAISNSENTSAKKTENYELHQQRIINTLTTINKSELNLRLAFINLYLQASESRIKQETDPIEKEALLDRTVKFLDANLISPKENSFPSKDAAQKYADKLSGTIIHIKEISEEFSENNTSLFKTDDEESPVNSLYFFKNSLINKILDQSNGLITVSNLGPAFKERFLENSNLKNILGKDQIAELKNGILIGNLKESK